MPEIGWLMNKKHLFFTFLEAEKSRIMAPTNLFFTEVFLDHRQLCFCFVLVLLCLEGVRELCGGHFYKN